MADDLSAPMGRKNRKDGVNIRRFSLRQLPLARIMFGLLALIFLVVAGRIIFADDPEGGRPVANVSISATRSTNQIATEVATEPVTAAPKADTTPMAEVPGSAGITSVGDEVPAAEPAALKDVAELTAFGVDPDLIEETQNGPIPRVGPTGETPFAAYSRASVTPTASSAPLIGIVVTGMGLSETGTLEAVEKLPDNITLAFAPYGHALQRSAGAARVGGHELMLEIPLEPFDYPDNDPGPQTLLTGQPARANLDRLFWLLARFGGYAGLINHMGARFTASAADMGPFMEEIGTRGLGYIDDGSSNRSLAQTMAQNNKIPFARGDMQIDANPSRTAILEALATLEKQAVEKGSAIGIASALPVSIQTITEWAEGLEAKGLILVPASALMTRPES